MAGEELEFLRRLIDQGFADIHRRMDDQRDLQTERHNTNVAANVMNATKLGAIDDEIKELNGTVIAHAEQLKTLFGRRAFVTWILGAVGGLAGILYTLHLLRVLP